MHCLAAADRQQAAKPAQPAVCLSVSESESDEDLQLLPQAKRAALKAKASYKRKHSSTAEVALCARRSMRAPAQTASHRWLPQSRSPSGRKRQDSSQGSKENQGPVPAPSVKGPAGLAVDVEELQEPPRPPQAPSRQETAAQAALAKNRELAAQLLEDPLDEDFDLSRERQLAATGLLASVPALMGAMRRRAHRGAAAGSGCEAGAHRAAGFV